MKTFDGYSKEKFSDTSVLLAGGGSKELSNFIGTLNWDSTNRKLQYKKIGDTNWSDLATFGSNALNSISYLPLTGGAINGNLIVNGNTTFKGSTSDSATVTDGNSNIVFDTLNNIVYTENTSLLLATFKNGGNIYGLLTAIPNEETGLYYNNYRLLTNLDFNNLTNLYWADIPISATSSTTTDPTFRYPASVYSRFTNGSEIIGYIGKGIPNSNTLYMCNYKSADINIFTDNNTSNCICLKTGGNVGIGTFSPSYKLHVEGDSYTTGWFRAGSGFYCQNYKVHYYGNSNNDAIIFTGPLNVVNFETSYGGNIYWFNYRVPASGHSAVNQFHFGASTGGGYGTLYALHYYESSDIRFKHNITDLNINSKKLSNLPLFDFTWDQTKGLPGWHTGTSAQEVIKVLPNIVSGDESFLTVDYGVLGTIAGITACKELVTLKSEIDLLKDRIELLELQLKMINGYGRC